MKKISVVLLVLISLSSFANNALNSKSNNFKNFDYEPVSACKVNDYGWVYICYVTIVNTVTGETIKVYSSGFGATKEEAFANCGRNARMDARIQARNLNLKAQ